jgi:hypothetical protein
MVIAFWVREHLLVDIHETPHSQFLHCFLRSQMGLNVETTSTAVSDYAKADIHMSMGI